MTSNLNGYSNYNPLNLTGKPMCTKQTPLSIINSIKTKIISQFIVPLFSYQWDILNENVLLIDNYKNQLNDLYSKYKLDELNMYNELLKVIQILSNEHSMLLESESKKNFIKDPNNIVSLVYKTTSIKLLPEYEIYNNIYGRPKKDNNEKYNTNIISEIQQLLRKQNITYSKIKEYLLQKHPKM